MGHPQLSMVSKRKRNDLSLADKYEAVKLLELKTSQSQISKKLGCSQAQISNISNNRETIKAEFLSDSNPERKRHRFGKARDVEKALTQWFVQARRRDMPLSGPILTEKATDLARHLQKEYFSPTNGWLARWKERNNIVFKRMNGRKKDVDEGTSKQWIEKTLPALLKSYQSDNVYNADETGLYYKAFPDGTLTFKTNSNGEKLKDRITVLVCTNMTGTDKRKLLVIGRSKEPRCFRGLKSLPVTYRHSRNAWMTAEIFTIWLLDFNRDMVRQGRKVLLLVDNCSAHPKDSADRLSNIRMELLPPNTSFIMPPCDQGIIRNLKSYYRSEVMRKSLRDIDNTEVKEKYMSLLDAIHMLCKAWRSVRTSTVVNCYRKAGFASLEPPDSQGISNVPPTASLKVNDYSNFVFHDDDFPCSDARTDEATCPDSHISPEQNNDPESDDNAERIPIGGELPVSTTDVRVALDTLLKFYSQKQCDDFDELYQVEETCERLMEKSRKQTR